MSMFRRCKHERVRCIHGDEILMAMTVYRARIRRQRCLDCGRALDRGLPDPCTVNGQPHARVEDGHGSTWVKCGPGCDLHVVRPGEAQCSCAAR